MIIAVNGFMKITKIALYIVLAVGIGAATYFLGYHLGKRDDFRQHLGLSLNKDLLLYDKVGSGDIAAAKTILRKYICGELHYYEQHFRAEDFVHLEPARKIAMGAPPDAE
jgi:hypothetical protein